MSSTTSQAGRLLTGIASLGEDRRRSLLWLAGLAVVASALFAFLVFPQLVSPLRVHHMRADGYYALAENLLSGRGFVFGDEPRFNVGAFKREPVYLLFLAAFLGLPGFPETLVLAHVVAHASTTALSYRLFLNSGFGDKPSFWAAAVFAVLPFSYWYAAKPTPENVTPLVVVLNVWLLQSYLLRPGPGRACVWGFVWALAVLSKSNLIILGPVGLLVMVIYAMRRRALLIHALVAVLCFAAGMFPWVARNYVISGRFIWGSSMSGTSFFVGNQNADLDTFRNLATELKGENAIYAEWKREYSRRRAATANPDPYRLEAETDAWYDGRVGQWIRANKGAFVQKIAINAGMLWFIADERPKSVILMCFQGPVALAALVGLWFAWRRGFSPVETQMALIMSGLYASHSAILAYARYTHVFLPFMAYFATVAAAHLIQRSPRPVPADLPSQADRHGAST